MKRLLSFLAMTIGFFLLNSTFASASSVIFNNITSPTPGNVPSIGYEATSTNEFGAQLNLAGTDRENPKVTVLMSSWGCQSGSWNLLTCLTTPGATFTHPITLNIYNVGDSNTVGTLLSTKTTVFTMPYRPSSDTVNCTGDDAGKWFDGTSCKNGKAFEISFSFVGITLPDNVIVTVEYNTSHYGKAPLGVQACSGTTEGCAYDSLNVGALTDITVGNFLPTVSDAYMTSTWGGAYCDSGVGGTGTLRLDAGCWTGYMPSLKIEANAPDADNDGVSDTADFCPGTVTDDDTWGKDFSTNRWQYMNGDKGWGWYQHVQSKKMHKDVYGYDISYTFGCSGQQILDLYQDKDDDDKGEHNNHHRHGHHKYGLSTGVLMNFHKDLLDGKLDGRYLVETVTVPSNSSTITTSLTTLNKHKEYYLTARGTWSNTNLNVADAEYASVDGWATWMQGYNISPWFLGANEFDLMVDNKFVNWGSYRTSHEYTREYEGKGLPVKFMVFDGDATIPLADPSWYGDNTGNLTVDIFEEL